MEIRKLQKSGNAYYLAIPKKYLSHIGIARKDYCKLTLGKDCIEVRKIGQ